MQIRIVSDFLRLLNSVSAMYPMHPCMEKRLVAEMRRLSTTDWMNYLDEGRAGPTKHFPLEIVFRLTQGRGLIVCFPGAYPFKGPEYYMQGSYIPHSLAVAHALQSKIPRELTAQLVEYLRSPTRTMLKRSLHDRLFYGGQARRATLLTVKYDSSVSPYRWSPSFGIAKQLPIIQELLAEVGLAYARPPPPAACEITPRTGYGASHSSPARRS